MKKLFYHSYSPSAFNLGTLVLRLVAGSLMITHGWDKLSHFASYKQQFISFMGLSPSVSLGLATFAEFFCSALLILGLFTRLATIPLLVTIFMILKVNSWDVMKHEVVPALGAIYLALLLFGPGKYSLDARISKK
ncbi:DoxX family protein [Taibaiella koreensis]|uniref:DoxX family protein n=1 Tax=Taibaiella koreensis TaxID=1268548 RepID=UPI0013C343CC|nr:DoxX family protein [Taibaiella koreensis]